MRQAFIMERFDGVNDLIAAIRRMWKILLVERDEVDIVYEPSKGEDLKPLVTGRLELSFDLKADTSSFEPKVTYNMELLKQLGCETVVTENVNFAENGEG